MYHDESKEAPSARLLYKIESHNHYEVCKINTVVTSKEISNEKMLGTKLCFS